MQYRRFVRNPNNGPMACTFCVVTAYLQGWEMTNDSEFIVVGIDVSKDTLELALDDQRQDAERE